VSKPTLGYSNDEWHRLSAWLTKAERARRESHKKRHDAAKLELRWKPSQRDALDFDTSARFRISESKQSLLYYLHPYTCERPCAELRHLRQLLAESYPVTELVKRALLHTRWGRELIDLARNWFSRNECLSQNFPLSRFLLPRIHGHKFRVRNVITRIFVAGRVVCT